MTSNGATLLKNAKVYVERGVYAQAAVVDGGEIKFVGDDESAAAFAGPRARVIDCGGYTLLPGLVDSHMHLMMFGEALSCVDIVGAKSIDDLVARCREFTSREPRKAERGIVSMGWDQDIFVGDRRMPNRHDLDRVSADRPVLLKRICGHVASANTKMIEMLLADAGTSRIPDGEIQLGDDGSPNGILRESAIGIASALLPAPTRCERRDAIASAMEFAASRGLTGVHSNDVLPTCRDPREVLDIVRGVYEDGRGKLRYRAQIGLGDVSSLERYLDDGEFARAYQDEPLFQIGPLKLFRDGSLGARTAMISGWSDAQEDTGLDEMKEMFRIARDHGVQVIAHAIGDAAVRDVIECCELAFVNGKNSLRHGIVHCQITDAASIERILRDDILIFAQPIFIDRDMKIVERLCGAELASTSYAFGTMLRRGGHLSYGTDCPVESCAPFPNIYAAVTRKSLAGDRSYRDDERVTVEEAIDAYTAQSAYAESAEDVRGRIKRGFCADMVLIDRDIFTCDERDIKDALPIMTMVGGEIVYKR